MSNNASQVQVALVSESTRGVVPASPRFRQMRITSPTPFKIDPKSKASDENRSDRQTADPIPLNTEITGTTQHEVVYPQPFFPESVILSSLFCNSPVSTNYRDNDGTANSAVTAVSASPTFFQTTSGSSWLHYDLLWTTGFASATNNGLWRLTAGTATQATVAGTTVSDSTPVGTARMKKVGFTCAANDITLGVATDGVTPKISSTNTDFTQQGLVPGQFLKIAGAAHAVNNTFVRITSISAGNILLDNAPPGWTAESTNNIQLFVPDHLVNGTAIRTYSVEEAFLGQATPDYRLHKGVICDKATFTITSESKLTISFDHIGIGYADGTTSNAASYVPARTERPMGANRNVAMLMESGNPLISSNPAQSVTVTVSNNNKPGMAVDQETAFETTLGALDVTAELNAHFMDNTLTQQRIQFTPTSLTIVLYRDNQAIVIHIPRLTWTADGQPDASDRNAQVMTKLTGTASIDAAVTGSMIIYDRFEYCTPVGT